MSIQVPNDQALSLEHRKYLEMLGQNDRCVYLDQQFPPDEAMVEEIARWRSGMPPSDLHALNTIGAPGVPLDLSTVSDEDLQAELERRTQVATDDDEGEPYDAWTNPELRAELKRRGMDESGIKAELVKRLEEHDALI